MSDIDYLVQSKNRGYSCCALLAAINARAFLDQKHPHVRIDSEEFEELAELVSCTIGAAIFVERAYPRLGLQHEEGVNVLSWFRHQLRSNYPVGINATHAQRGAHTGLVVAVKGKKLTIVNWDKGKVFTRVDWDDICFMSGLPRPRAFSLL